MEPSPALSINLKDLCDSGNSSKNHWQKENCDNRHQTLYRLKGLLETNINPARLFTK